MENNLDKLEASVEEKIRNYTGNFNEIFDKLTTSSSNSINSKLWKLRADLELLIIEIKFLLKKEDLTERWQSSFRNELKGTSSKHKAETLLKEYNVDKDEVISDFKKRPESVYKFLWKLKETISSVLSAFPSNKIDLFNGEVKESSKDVFEI